MNNYSTVYFARLQQRKFLHPVFLVLSGGLKPRQVLFRPRSSFFSLLRHESPRMRDEYQLW